MARHNTARLILNIDDALGEPVVIESTANELIDDVAQAIRTAGHAQHCDHTETIAQVVAARLSVTWPSTRSAPEPEPTDTLDV